jgi:cytochrome c553
MMRTAWTGAGAVLSALGFGAAALASQAQTTPPTVPQVDVTACQACHGESGISRNPHIPHLAGQQEAYLAAQLQAFRAHTRRNESMEAVAGQLSDAEIAGLAAYWAHRQFVPPDAHGQASGPAIPSRMTFPAGFPAGFTAYETVPAEGGGTAERFANAAALAAARAGHPLPDGSVIVVVNRNATGAATSYAAMASQAGWGDAVPALLRNGNWDYALFDAGHVRNDGLNQAQCLACHRPKEADSFVFTLAALRERARRPVD